MDTTTDTRFPDCEIYRIPQHLNDGSANPEWLELRKGVLTASEFGMWLVAEKKIQLTVQEIKDELNKLKISYPKSGKKEDYEALLPDPTPYLDYDAKSKEARENAICRIVAETAGLWEPEQRWTKEEMQRGLDLEPEAVSYFEKATGKKVEHVGFCKSIHGHFGCSPDGLIIGESEGFEGKVPLPSTHIKYRRANVLPDEYKVQVHGSMAVTGASHWHFQSWNPCVAGFQVTVERDDFTEQLFEGLKSFSRDVDIALEEEKVAFEADRERGLV